MRVFCLLLGLGITAAGGPEAVEREEAPGAVEVGVVVETPNDLTYQIGLMLRCPVCQGMPIAESPAEMAQAMMTRIRELHKEGKSKDEILGYFVARYGEWVVLEPKKEGLNWLVWVVPPAVLFLLVAAMVGFLKSKASPMGPAGGEERSVDDEVARAIREDVLS